MPALGSRSDWSLNCEEENKKKNMRQLLLYVAVVYFANVPCHGISVHRSGLKMRNRRENSDECRPFPPPHRHHGHHHGPEDYKKMPPMCCELPEILSVEEGSFDKCRDLLCRPGYSQAYGTHKHGHKKDIKRFSEDSQRMTISESQLNWKKGLQLLETPFSVWHSIAVLFFGGVISNESDGTLLPPPPMDFFQDKNECLQFCVFAVSGLLTENGSLNGDLLLQNKLMQMAMNNTKWATKIDPAYRKCIGEAKEATSQSQMVCKPGPAEYMKCMSRELFFNCPRDLWVDSTECDEFKNKLEKCPNLWALDPPFYEPYPPGREPYPSVRESYSVYHEPYQHRSGPISITLIIND